MFAIIFLTLAMFVPVVSAADGDAKAGQATFDKRCKACHGAQGQGNPAMSKALKVEFRDLKSAEVQAKSDAELKKSMLGGYGKKKPITLTDKEASDATAFIRSLAKK